MKIRTEIISDGDEEIVIRCKEKNEKTAVLEEIIQNAIKSQKDVPLYIANTEYFINKKDILFFETNDGKLYAHTKNGMYLSHNRLFEIENMMPSYFVRIAKSAIVNVKKIASLRRELTGNGEIEFKDCNKKIYFSRAYYKILRDKIEEIRL